jgi:DNA-binding LacI/PurR family transcriptional regulator
MASIKDVARLAHVAPSTVSNVLNCKNNVKEETILRVYEAIKALDYTPNFHARGLRGKRTSMIGIVIPNIGNPFYMLVVRGIEDIADRNDYTVVLCNTDDDIKKERICTAQLKMKSLDGLIICSSLLSEQELLGIGMPVVLIDRITDNPELCSININNIRAGYVAAEHLINTGRKKIGIITGPLYYYHFRKRMEGYLNSLSDHKIGLDYNLVAETSPDRKGGYDAMGKLYKNSPDIDAVFAENDLMAIGAIKFLLENGVQIPRDVSVIGFDNIDAATIVNPSLTTIDQPQYKIGEMAMNQLVKIMHNDKIESPHIEIEPKLIKRESS